MKHFETRAVHDGQEPDPVTGSVTVPVYQTSTFAQDGIGRPRGYEYSRTGNPTRAALETALASLENGSHALSFASGVAATDAVMRLLRPGDRVVATEDIYGGTFRLFDRLFRPWGLRFDYVPTSDPAAVAAAFREPARLLWIESPTNPLLRLADLQALSALARERGAWTAVDNTFASPFFQRPLDLGADLVVHSATKYLGGHSDLIGGAVVVRDRDLFERLRYIQNAAGAVPGPWDCWLLLRGLKTLPLRMRAHERNALAIAHRLESHPAVERVHYPGLPGHPQHDLARRQMDGFGGMVSIELRGGFPAVERMVSRLRLFILAESLGGVESLVCYPPKMTHAAFTPQERNRRGIRDALVRLSVGIEHGDDLIADLEQALETESNDETVAGTGRPQEETR
jgi:cystathionine beta-lyase/cystathionine gamma-synthase